MEEETPRKARRKYKKKLRKEHRAELKEEKRADKVASGKYASSRKRALKRAARKGLPGEDYTYTGVGKAWRKPLHAVAKKVGLTKGRWTGVRKRVGPGNIEKKEVDRPTVPDKRKEKMKGVGVTRRKFGATKDEVKEDKSKRTDVEATTPEKLKKKDYAAIDKAKRDPSEKGGMKYLGDKTFDPTWQRNEAIRKRNEERAKKRKEAIKKAKYKAGSLAEKSKTTQEANIKEFQSGMSPRKVYKKKQRRRKLAREITLD
jgi:hypothetical protein